jgi:hypothetical protein
MPGLGRRLAAQLGAGTISAQLADRIDSLARHLLPHGVYGYGRRHWRCGSVRGEPGQSLCLRLDGPLKGRFRDYSSGECGDALDLVALVACNGDLGAACKWARDWLGLGSLDPAEAGRLTRLAEAARDERRRRAESECLAAEQDAKRVWLAGAPLRPGDAGWLYLADCRLIDMTALEAPPRALRLHPALYNPESRRPWPALMAAICAPDGRHVNTHRIWLDARRDGSVAKAPLDRPKLSMPGGYAGGCVRLWRGASGKPGNAMPGGETVLAGEGIEDVMTIVCARPDWRAVAVLSVSSLVGLVLPPQVTRLIWIAQNDPPGSPAANALARALREHRSRGLTVAAIRPPRPAKDVNEWTQQLAEEPDDVAA